MLTVRHRRHTKLGRDSRASSASGRRRFERLPNFRPNPFQFQGWAIEICLNPCNLSSNSIAHRQHRSENRQDGRARLAHSRLFVGASLAPGTGLGILHTSRRSGWYSSGSTARRPTLRPSRPPGVGGFKSSSCEFLASSG